MQKLKSLFLLIVGMFTLVGVTHAEMYDIDLAHSKVGFRVRHIVSRTSGSFDNFSGSVNFDESKPESLQASVVIKTESVNTANAKRDEHLKSPDFFNVAKFPEMTFKVTQVTSTAPNKLAVTGDLTLLGVTKPVTLNTEVLGVANDPWGNKRLGMSATGTLNRKDYGMVFNMAMDKGGFVIGDDVELIIEVEGVAKQPAAKEPMKKEKKK